MKNIFKNNKMLLWLFSAAILLTFIGLFSLRDINESDVAASTPNTTENDTTDDNSSKDNNTESVPKDTWDASAVYNAGDQVIFGGKIFEAKWWTQGKQPDASNEWGEWKLIGDATPTKEDSSTNSDSDEYVPTGEGLAGSEFKVVGYFPEWKPAKEKEIQYDKLTHINYSFAIPTSEGTVKPLTEPELAKKIIKKGNSNGVKVLIAVGGWEYNGTPLENTFVAATDSDAKCKKLADSILAMVDEYGFDGVDMDWEHPRVDGVSKTQYSTLLKYLRQGLDKRNKILTSAVLAGVTADGNVLYDAAGHTDEALSYVDWINVMAYDGGDGDRHSSYDFAVNSANYWRKTRKLPASKVVLGVPFYGRPSWASYEDILKADSSAHKKDKATIDGKEAHYNGIDTIKKKTEWAMKNTSGVMIWEISQDTTDKDKSLLNVIYEVVK